MTRDRTLLKTIGALLLTLSGLASAQAAVEAEPISLQPTMTQRYASNLATRFLTNSHFRDIRLDDQLSSEILDIYIETLDPNRSYFLAQDIASFERYRHELDDALRQNYLNPAFEIFNLYSQRARQRAAYAIERVQQPFDFDLDEDYVYDREEAPWAESHEELDEIWRQRVKNDYLRLKLTDKEPAEIVETLVDRYEGLDRRVAELNSDDVFQFFMNAFASSIEPHTSYLSPRNSENFEISMRLSLEGIGALLGREAEYTQIARVVPGGPASMDGRLQAGDRIVSVGQGDDGKLVDVIGWRVDDVVELIRGPKDTVVRLEVLPADEGMGGATSVIDLVRDEVKLEEQAAQSRVIELPDADGAVRKVGVIDLPVFYLDFNGRAMNKPDYRSSSRDVARLIDELEEEGIESLVIDLRDNGGGSLLEATNLTGLFIDRGPVVQVKQVNGRISVEEDDDPGMAWDGPLVVLVNRHSASASEIFAAAIQDYGRGVVVGEPTFGKGTVQSLLQLDDYTHSDREGLGQLKMTVAQFFRVNGGSTQNRGVYPDIPFPYAGEPGEFGESALDNALPWTEIRPARYRPSDDLAMMVAVASSRHQERVGADREFNWLLEDIGEYNAHREEIEITLLESARRDKLAADEAKRAERKAEREAAGLPDREDHLVGSDIEVEREDEDAIAGEEDEDAELEEADFLLREAARIAADMAELRNDEALLSQEFAVLSESAPKSELLQ